MQKIKFKKYKTKRFHSNGQVAAAGKYTLESYVIGEWLYYYSNGAVRSKGKYDRYCNKIGEWLYFHPDGVIKNKITYQKQKQNKMSYSSERYFRIKNLITMIQIYESDPKLATQVAENKKILLDCYDIILMK